jgi:hypothetical protein
MSELKYELLTEVQGRAEAEVLKAFLLGNGIEDVELIQESLGQSVYPTTLDILGNVQLFVPKEQAEAARQLLDEYQALPDEPITPEATEEDEPA